MNHAVRLVALSLGCLLPGIGTGWAWSQPGAERVVGPLLEWDDASLERFDASWLHLKFNEGFEVNLAAAPTPAGVHFVEGDGRAHDQVNGVLDRATEIARTFPGDVAKFRDWKERGEAASGRPGPDLSLWYNVRIPGGRKALADAINALNAINEVEIAHPAPMCEPARIVHAAPLPMLAPRLACGGTPDFSDLQDYLYETPIGLDAPSAWAMPGGRGAGTKFIDVELGWSHMHEDFRHDQQFYEGGGNDPSSGYRDHGTAVVGEVVGALNGFGITGFASDAQWGTVGIDIDAWPVVPQWFMEAAEALDPGDVWLIELQMFPAGRNATPMEYVQVNYDVIWTSSWALDVVCVEAGANGSQDLDSPVWGGLFDRNIRDSGAIMVAAGTPTGRVAEGFTNYGSRMDVHAWGSSIVTTGYGDLYDEGPPETEYTRSFGGTSGASPMVVGSALCLQGIARDFHGEPLTPLFLRTLLNKTGIDHLGTRMIGPRPDLGAATSFLVGGVSDLAELEIVTGTLLGGDISALSSSDDSYVHTRSGFGQTFVDLHHMELHILASTAAPSPATIDLTIEARIDEPAGTAQVRLLNDGTGAFDLVGTFPLGDADEVETIDSIPAGDYVNPHGEIELSIKHVVFVNFLAFTFESFVDWVEIDVR